LGNGECSQGRDGWCTTDLRFTDESVWGKTRVKSIADLHGLDRIMSLLDGIYLNELGGMRKQKLIDDFKLVIGGLD